jgi:hypothetical protein
LPTVEVPLVRLTSISPEFYKCGNKADFVQRFAGDLTKIESMAKWSLLADFSTADKNK